VFLSQPNRSTRAPPRTYSLFSGVVAIPRPSDDEAARWSEVKVNAELAALTIRALHVRRRLSYMPWWPLVLGAGLVLALVMLRLSQRGRRFALELSANWRRLVDAASGVSKEQRLVLYVLRYATKGNPQSVLDTIDRYCREQTWHMNVGDDKGELRTRSVQKLSPSSPPLTALTALRSPLSRVLCAARVAPPPQGRFSTRR
jgi:hypothetical protein